MSIGTPRKNRREYMREYARTHSDKWAENARKQRARRRAVIHAAKDTPCVDCGVKYPPYVMDLHHVRGTKTMTLGEVGCTSLARIQIEITKCIVLCSNCHRSRTHRN